MRSRLRCRAAPGGTNARRAAPLRWTHRDQRPLAPAACRRCATRAANPHQRGVQRALVERHFERFAHRRHGDQHTLVVGGRANAAQRARVRRDFSERAFEPVQPRRSERAQSVERRRFVEAPMAVDHQARIGTHGVAQRKHAVDAMANETPARGGANVARQDPQGSTGHRIAPHRPVPRLRAPARARSTKPRPNRPSRRQPWPRRSTSWSCRRR